MKEVYIPMSNNVSKVFITHLISCVEFGKMYVKDKGWKLNEGFCKWLITCTCWSVPWLVQSKEHKDLLIKKYIKTCYRVPLTWFSGRDFLITIPPKLYDVPNSFVNRYHSDKQSPGLLHLNHQQFTSTSKNEAINYAFEIDITSNYLLRWADEIYICHYWCKSNAFNIVISVNNLFMIFLKCPWKSWWYEVNNPDACVRVLLLSRLLSRNSNNMMYRVWA